MRHFHQTRTVLDLQPSRLWSHQQGCEVALVTSVCHLPVEWVAVGVRPKFLSLIDVYRPWGNVAKHVEGGPAAAWMGRQKGMCRHYLNIQ